MSQLYHKICVNARENLTEQLTSPVLWTLKNRLQFSSLSLIKNKTAVNIKNVLILTLTIAVSATILFFLFANKGGGDRDINTTNFPSPVASTTTSFKQITMDDIATHKDVNSCWVTIEGSVYDLTEWINKHPGGPDKIIPICGTDATQAFTAQHVGAKKPATELAKFLIGKLAL